MKTCGDFGGIKPDGTPCGAPAGRGTSRKSGRCRYHPEDPAAQELTAREAAFCEEYLVDRNGAQAAIRAGYSSHTARQTAHKLLQKPHIRARIRERLDEHFSELGLQQRFLLGRLAAMAGADIADFVEWKGRHVHLKDSSEIPPELTPLVKSVKETKEGLSLELHDAKDAIKVLLEYHQMLRKPVDVNVSGEVRHRHSKYEAASDEELFRTREEALAAAIGGAGEPRQNGNDRNGKR